MLAMPYFESLNLRLFKRVCVCPHGFNLHFAKDSKVIIIGHYRSPSISFSLMSFFCCTSCLFFCLKGSFYCLWMNLFCAEPVFTFLMAFFFTLIMVYLDESRLLDLKQSTSHSFMVSTLCVLL